MNAPEGSGYFGVYPAVVCEIGSSDYPGQVRLRFDWFDPAMETSWCRICNPYAGNGYGFVFHPEKDDEVLVGFVFGEMAAPVVLGGLYNGEDKPRTFRSNDQDEKIIRTRAGHQITLDDTSGKEKIRVVDSSGANSIEIDAVANSITITATGKLTLKGKGIEIASDGDVTITGTQINLN
jgi:uncharacterized protein involved in type VI secretion and phage assembly